MNIGFVDAAANLGMGLEWILFLMFILGGLLFYVKGFTFGSMMHFFTFAVLFLICKVLNLNYVPALIATFIFFIAMCLSLYSEYKTSYEVVV
jgi:hypothetical protein